MKHLPILLVLLMAVPLTGCLSNKPKFRYPSDISSECHHGRNTSKAKIESKGTALKVKKGVTLVKHPGEKKISGMWCWMDPSWGMYVGGLCWGSRIEVGCHPQTGGEVMFAVVEHEHGHYWLITNYGDYSHNPLYRGVFHNWVEPRTRVFVATPTTLDAVKAQVKAAAETMQHGEWISVQGVDEDGVKYIIDFVVNKAE